MWADSYAPKSFAEVKGHLNAIARCKDWLRKFPSKGSFSDRVLLISGPEGCGKSLIARLLLSEMRYRISAFSLRDIRNHKKDQDLLGNFCELYQSDFRHLGTAHAMILEDFDSVSKADKVFHAALVHLIKSQPSSCLNLPPLIITMTTKADISEKRRTQKYQGLAKLAYEVSLEPIRETDLEEIFQTICLQRSIQVESKVCQFLAEHCLGDARKGIQSLELLVLSKKFSNVITNEQTEIWIDVNKGDDDEKLVYSSTANANGTDEERILRAAIRDENQKVQKAAKQLVVDNSLQFSPLIFQAYPVLCKSIEEMADIAEDFSLADYVKENSWNSMSADESDEWGFMSISSIYSVEVPLSRLAGSNRPIKTDGYQTYYGIENTISSQKRAILAIKNHHSNHHSIGNDHINVLQMVVSELFSDGSVSDEEIISRLHLLNLHPEILEKLAKIKGTSEVDKSCMKLGKKRLRELTILFDDLETETTKATVKFLEPCVSAQPGSPHENNPFHLTWN
jgi:Holliday junction resolvasome RuvABC ATP-dependent DNA helicase subunit